jgi:hypothetical protein
MFNELLREQFHVCPVDDTDTPRPMHLCDIVIYWDREAISFIVDVDGSSVEDISTRIVDLMEMDPAHGTDMYIMFNTRCMALSELVGIVNEMIWTRWYDGRLDTSDSCHEWGYHFTVDVLRGAESIDPTGIGGDLNMHLLSADDSTRSIVLGRRR